MLKLFDFGTGLYPLTKAAERFNAKSLRTQRIAKKKLFFKKSLRNFAHSASLLSEISVISGSLW